MSFWKKANGFSSDMVLNILAMASLCLVRSRVRGEGGEEDVMGEGGEGEGRRVKGELGVWWILVWCLKSPGVGKERGHSGQA